MWLRNLQGRSEYRSLRRMTYGGPVLVCVMLQVGNWNRIQFLLGHVSVQTTEKYLGYKQRLRGAVNDRIGIEL